MNHRLISISKKLYNTHKGTTSSNFFGILRTNPHFKILFDNFNPKEIAILCLLVGNMKETTDVYELYKDIIKNLFIFSIVLINDEEYFTTCNDCGGDGEVFCNNCGGDTKVDCEECDGFGEDSEGIDCRFCNNGQTNCKYCSNGFTLCEKCDGTGEELMNEHQEIVQEFFVSFDKNLYNFLETKVELMDEIQNSTYDKILKSKKTFISFESYGPTDEFNNYQKDDYVFAGLSKDNVNFFFNNNFLDPQGIVSYI